MGIVAGLAGMDLVLLMLLWRPGSRSSTAPSAHDRALEFHRKLGKPALLPPARPRDPDRDRLRHGGGLDPVSEAVALWVLVPDMWLAFVSMVLFIAVVVTSLVAVRRRFPYEFWYAVHLLTYAAVLTALPHQFSVGALFAEGTWQRWYWLALCIATGAALLYYRVVQPLVATFRHQLTVKPRGAGGPRRGQHRNVRPSLDQLAGSGGRFFIWRFLAPGPVVASAPVQPVRRTRARSTPPARAR